MAHTIMMLRRLALLAFWPLADLFSVLVLGSEVLARPSISQLQGAQCFEPTSPPEHSAPHVLVLARTSSKNRSPYFP